MINFLEIAIPILMILTSLICIVKSVRFNTTDYLTARLMIIGFPVIIVFSIGFIIAAISMLKFGHWING